MKINPIVRFSNNFIQPIKRSITPTLGFDSVSFTNAKPEAKSASLLDKITPSVFKDETLNSIFQRSTEISTIDTQNARTRSEDNAILTQWFTDEGLEKMQSGKAYPEMMRGIEELIYDGVSFKQRDEFYMMAVQRLIDSGAIDDKTFVLIDTGHSIPIAAQLMKEENKAALGEVKGTFLFDSTFPQNHPNVNPQDEEATAISLDIRERSHQRISSQILDFGDIIENANKNSKGKGGALFIGVDAHRYAKFDTSKLPTAQELKKLGLNKVAIIQEVPPLSSFSQNDVEKLFSAKTKEMVEQSLSNMNLACGRAKRTPLGTEIDEDTKARIKRLLTRASDIIKPDKIEKTYPGLSSPDKKKTSKLIETEKFGYGMRTAHGSDVNEYLRYLKKNSGATIFIEGAALLKLREAPVETFKETKDFMLQTYNDGFDKIISGNFDV